MQVNRRFINIDALRILSLLLVMCSHYGLENFKYIDGTHGVVLFFCISGFCMNMTANSKLSFLDFWLARLKRLVPTFIVCSLIVTVFKIIFSEYTGHRTTGIKEFIYTTICVPTLDLPCVLKAWYLQHGDYGFVDGSYWSLLVEFRFYFLFGVLYFLLGLKKYIGVLISILTLVSFLTIDLSENRLNDIFQYMCFFGFGIGFNQIQKSESRFYGKLSILSSATVLGILYSAKAKSTSMPLMYEMIPSYYIMMILFIFFMIVFRRIAAGDVQTAIISRIGFLTYPAYLLHQDIGLIVLRIFEKSIDAHVVGIITIFGIFILAEVTERLTSLAMRSIAFRSKS